MILLPLLLVFTLTNGAPLLGQDYSGRIADEYIVIYKEETVNDVIFAHQAELTSNIKFTYNISNDYRGFSAHLNPDELSKVLDLPFVKEVHCNGHVHTYCSVKQSPSTSWGIARVSHSGPLRGPLNYEFNHHPNPGQGTHVYILDTGVMATHEQFNGRVAPGMNFVPGETPADQDQNGHGTHCAGTAAGNTYGIAHNARIIPIKVLGRGGSGSFDGVIAGVSWAANDHNGPNPVPGVASMSLGAGSDGGMNSAVEAAIRSGLPFCVAAGNNAGNACNFYPASAVGAITVGSSDIGGEDQDVISYFSNHGNCVEIFAPGSDIPSSYIPNYNSYAVLSGTSMACPHVAGLSAFILGSHPGVRMSPVELEAALVNGANTGVFTNLPAGSPNKLLYNGCGTP